MVRFEQALLDGELLSPASLQAMLGETRRGFQPGMYYGLGTMVYDIFDRGGRLRWRAQRRRAGHQRRRGL